MSNYSNNDFYPPRPENWDDPHDKHPKIREPKVPQKPQGSHWNTPINPRVVTISDLFPRLDRWGIGWSPILEQLKEIAAEKPSYPPYDIIDHKNDTTVVSVAVAGFTKKELEVTVDDGTLKIEGKKKAKKEEGQVVYQGIAARNFVLTFALAEYYEVQSASVEDGMLSVVLFKNVPEEKKPKVIDIK
jgi:molecular chaperone IbpA